MPEQAADRNSLVDLLAASTLDAELASLLWILLEQRIALVVAEAAAGGMAGEVLGGLLDLVPPTTRRVAVTTAADVLRQGADTLIVAEPILEPGGAGGSASRARAVVRAAGRGQAIAGTIQAASLEEVLARLSSVPVLLDRDELTRLGVVLVLAQDRPARVVAAHYLRPVARDGAGHVQRLGPAVLATLDEATGSFDHFEWGILPELAFRTGLRAGDLDGERAARAAFLRALVDAGRAGRTEVTTALEGYRRHRHGSALPG